MPRGSRQALDAGPDGSAIASPLLSDGLPFTRQWLRRLESPPAAGYSGLPDGRECATSLRCFLLVLVFGPGRSRAGDVEELLLVLVLVLVLSLVAEELLVLAPRSLRPSRVLRRALPLAGGGLPREFHRLNDRAKLGRRAWRELTPRVSRRWVLVLAPSVCGGWLWEWFDLFLGPSAF